MEIIQVEEPVYENVNTKKSIVTVIKGVKKHLKTAGAVIACIIFGLSLIIYIHGQIVLPSDSPELKAREEKLSQAFQNLILFAKIQEETTERLPTDNWRTRGPLHRSPAKETASTKK